MSGGDKEKRESVVAIVFGLCLAVAVFCSYAWMFYDIGASTSQYAADSERNSQHNAAYTAQRVENECVEREGKALRDCIAEAIQAGAEYQQGERDLDAQRGMAKWARWLLIITGGQLIATIVGLIYLKGTLDATWRAVRDTGDATMEMREANQIAREDQRPMLTVNARIRDQLLITAEQTEFLGEPQIHLSLDLIIKNIGKKPANFIWHESHLFVPDGEGDEPLRADEIGKDPPEKRGFLLFPGEEVTKPDTAWCPISEFDQSPLFAKINMGQIALVVVVWYGEKEGSPWLYSRQVFRLWGKEKGDAFNMFFEKRTAAYSPRDLELELCSGGVTI